MGNVQLVGHQLVGVLAVGFTKIFMQLYSVADGENGVGSIDSQENYVREILSGENQFAEGKEQHESYRNRAYIAGETLRLLAKIEETEHQ